MNSKKPLLVGIIGGIVTVFVDALIGVNLTQYSPLVHTAHISAYLGWGVMLGRSFYKK